MSKPVFFYPNTPDNTHCFQAALKMVLKEFIPEREFSWEELDILTGKQNNMWTWPQQALIAVQQMGFEVANIDTFDYASFIDHGVEYLQALYGNEVGQEQEKHSDIAHEQEISKVYKVAGIHEQRVPTLEDIQRYLADNWLVICNVNACSLANKPGYIGHSVLVYSMDDTLLKIHDPGLPPLPAQLVTRKQFTKAWAYGGLDSPEILAFRIKN